MNWTLINSQAMDCPAKMMLVHTSIIFDSGFLNFRLHVEKNNLLGVGRYKIQQLFFQNALLSAVPFLCNWIYSIFYSRILDMFVQKKIITTTVARKVSMGIGKHNLIIVSFFP